jgi:nitrate/TMAO reductase-like tetraheme cytochrome c subunit
MRLAGIKRRPGKRLKWGLTRWGMFLTLFLLLMGGMAGFAEYSMQPDFCRSCHIMEPYYQAWHQSTHKNVPCTDCHFEPGMNNTVYGKFQASSQAVKYVTATYGSKPHAEIRDSSCMRSGCHEKRLLMGKVDWPVTTERGGKVTIKFDHTPHLTMERRGKQLRCVSCHSQIVQGQHLVVTTDTCFLCHFKGLKHGRDDQTVGTCRGCHDEPKQPIALPTGLFTHSQYTTDRGVKCENCHSDTVRGDGAVPQQVCWNCHNQTAQIAKYGEPNMLHKAHVTDHKVECSACHVQIEHSLVAGERETHMAGTRFATDSGTCGSCHEQLHAGPREMFRGVGGRGVPDMPSPMARARVNCIACHMTKKESSADAQVAGQTFVATQDRCDYCHGDKYKGVLDDWRKLVKTNLDKAEAALLTARKLQTSAKMGSEEALKVARLLDDADYNVRFVKLGHGVHNVTYATALCNVAQDRCREAMTLMNGKTGAAP